MMQLFLGSFYSVFFLVLYSVKSMVEMVAALAISSVMTY